MRRLNWNRDRFLEVWTALAVAVIASIGFVAVPNLVAGWAFVIPGTTDAAMAPTFFPRVALGMTIATCLLVIATASMRSEALPFSTMSGPRWRRLAQLFVINAAYFVGLRWIGFILSSVALLIVVPLLVGYRKVVPILLTAAILPPVIWLLFWHGLRVVLPTGRLLD
jgi:Tripartite tricarboxylate transporter TctB family